MIQQLLKAFLNFALRIITPAFYKFIFEILMNFLKELNLGLKKYGLKEEEKELLDRLDKIQTNQNINKDELDKIQTNQNINKSEDLK